ncbi:MAG: Gfo/Idh/MocA family oxidoreductase [Magnetococcales bacterium]|nr:Gfo/Idh/MocA family oxidoreductase [Magnetococcales bacterium]
MTLRAVLIGCGKIGSTFADDPRIRGVLTHAEAYVVCPETTLVAVADPDRNQVERCGDRWGVACRHTDPLRMLTEVQPDLVSICAPDETHVSLTQAALRTPGVRGILAEKPLAMSPDEARELVDEAEARGIALAVNHSRRYARGHAWLRAEIQAGRLGAIQRVSGYYTKGTLHNGTHWFDLLRFLIGEVVAVRAWNHLHEPGPDPTLDLQFELSHGVLATLSALDSQAFSLFEMDIVGSLGRARMVDSGHWIELQQHAPSPYYSGYDTLVAQERVSGVLEDVTLRAVENLVHCLRHGEHPVSSGRDGWQALRIGSALHASSRQGGVRIELPDLG